VKQDAAHQFGDRLREVLDACRVSQRGLAERCGVPRDVVSRTVLGKAQAVAHHLLLGAAELCIEHGVSLEWLLTGRGEMMRGESLREAGVDELLRALAEAMLREGRLPPWLAAPSPAAPQPAAPQPPAPQPTTALRVRIAEPGYRTIGPESVGRYGARWSEYCVPVIGRIAAGEGADTVEATEHPPAWAGEFVLHSGAPAGAVAVRVAGESMAPAYRDGDMVIVDPTRPAESGVCVVLVEVDGHADARLKRLRLRARDAILESVNPAYPPQTIPRRRILRTMQVRTHLPLVMREYPAADE